MNKEFRIRCVRWCLYTALLWAALCIPPGRSVLGGGDLPYAYEVALFGGPLWLFSYFFIADLSDTVFIVINASYFLMLSGVAILPLAYPPGRRVRVIVVSVALLALVVLFSIWAIGFPSNRVDCVF